MGVESVWYAKQIRKDKERLERQMEKNKRIRNFNKTLGTIFNILAATVNPAFAIGSSAIQWLNPEKKYKTELFLGDQAKSLNRERKENIPAWYNMALDIGLAGLGYHMGGKELGAPVKKAFGNIYSKFSSYIPFLEKIPEYNNILGEYIPPLG